MLVYMCAHGSLDDMFFDIVKEIGGVHQRRKVCAPAKILHVLLLMA
jgi:hypothetical protein